MKCEGKSCNRLAEFRIEWDNKIVDVCFICAHELCGLFQRTNTKYSIYEIMEEKVIFT